MYLVWLWPGVIYRRKEGTHERPYTLVEAMREVYGCGQARILRLDGTVVVDRAGSSTQIIHVPTGRKINRRRTRWASKRWEAEMAEWNALRRQAETAR